jgi:hypothetical protein
MTLPSSAGTAGFTTARRLLLPAQESVPTSVSAFALNIIAEKTAQTAGESL